jgi:tRNA(His) guanylyltransferase
LSWRQADCHINNQYNSVFWALVGRGESREAAQARLAGTLTADKNELLFADFGVSYAALPPAHRKGSVLRRRRAEAHVKTLPDGTPVMRMRTEVLVEHKDIIGDAFWTEHPELLAG